MSVRFGIVGCGKITQRLALPQLKTCADAEITALVDVNRSLAEQVAETAGVAPTRIWTDWKRMLREAEVDAVAVNVPNVLHAEVAVAALAAKKHVIVEKPIATTLADADAMIQAAKTNSCALMVEQTQRFDSVHEVAHDILQRGELGPVTHLRGRIGHAGPQYWSGSGQSWFTDARQSGGGVLMDVGIHLVDLLRWLSGKQVTRIFCSSVTRQKTLTVEDNASALLEWSDGTRGSFDVSWTTQPYEVATQWYGEQGILRTAIGISPHVMIQRSQRDGDPNQPLGDPVCPPISSTSRTGGAYPAFISSIIHHTPPPVSGEDGRAALEIILAAYESARTNAWVTLPLLGAKR